MKRLLITLCFVITATLAHSQVYYIREGQTSYGKILYNYDTKTKLIREGQTSYGKILFNIDKNFVREGQVSYGKIKYYIEKR